MRRPRAGIVEESWKEAKDVSQEGSGQELKGEMQERDKGSTGDLVLSLAGGSQLWSKVQLKWRCCPMSSDSLIELRRTT